MRGCSRQEGQAGGGAVGGIDNQAGVQSAGSATRQGRGIVIAAASGCAEPDRASGTKAS